MANIKLRVGLFVCSIILMQIDQFACVDSGRCDKNAMTCDQRFPKITKNASKSMKANASSHDIGQIHQPLDSLMLQYNSNYESSKYNNWRAYPRNGRQMNHIYCIK